MYSSSPFPVWCMLSIQCISAQMATTLSSVQTPTANPCALISSSANAVHANDPAATPSLIPSQVYACQRDVPFNSTLVVAQIATLRSYITFQSTLAYLKAPPASYDLPPVDLLGGLDAIAAKASASGYDNEFEVENDIYQLQAKVGDGHFMLWPYLIGAFGYVTGVNLVSVSPDGVQLPRIYVESELQASLVTNSTPSAISAINGVGSETYLAQAGLYAPFQDLDAKYNSLLYNPSVTAIHKFLPVGYYYGTTNTIHHNDTTTYTFANGTVRTLNNYAIPMMSIDFDSGSAFFSKHILPLSTTTASSTVASSTTLPVPTDLPGYPTPFVTQDQNYLSGYFFNGSGLSDTAVLSIRSFSTETQAEVTSFMTTVRSFLAECASRKKQRLLIDVRGNNGGDLILPIDTFRQLFPSKVPYSGIRWRLTDAANFLGSQISKITPPVLAQHPELSTAYNSLFNSRDAASSPSGPPFETWESLADPPVFSHGDRFTKTVSWNFNNRALDASLGGPPAGYLNNTNLPPQVFAEENITILTDGACSSACAAFVNLLVRQTSAKSIVLGGRPIAQPMALIGGTQGGEEVAWADIQSYVKSAVAIYNETSSSNGDSTSTSQIEEITKELELLVKDTPLQLWGGLGFQKVNNRDNIAPGDEEGTPLQFIKMLADCRGFYMASDIYDVDSTWRRVIQGVEKGGEGLCVNGTVGSWVESKNGTSIRNGTVTDTKGSAATSSPAFTGVAICLDRGLGAMVWGLTACLLLTILY